MSDISFDLRELLAQSSGEVLDDALRRRSRRDFERVLIVRQDLHKLFPPARPHRTGGKSLVSAAVVLTYGYEISRH